MRFSRWKRLLSAVTRKRGKEPRKPLETWLSHTETFVKKVTDMLRQGLTAENYKAALQSILELCEGDYDLNRAGAAAMKVAEKKRHKGEAFNLYYKMAGDLFRMQCESERSSGRTTIFTGFYDSAIDAYLDGGYAKEAAAVAFEHSHWLMRSALYRDEAGKQKYLGLSSEAFDQVMKRADEELAGFIYEQREGKSKAAVMLRDVQPPTHLKNVKDAEQLRRDALAYRQRIAFLERTCKTYDIAAYLSSELATVLEKALPQQAAEHRTFAEELHQRHVALLDEHGISAVGP
jgi:hypothetical protein